jgi:dTDP-4-dehydrorhamnose reductase
VGALSRRVARVLVTGAGGQLGTAIVHRFSDAGVVAHTHESLDVTDPKAVARAVADAKPDLLVNCAAFNDVDAAEDRPSEALAVNAFAVRSLARAASDAGATLVHFGTDFVFDGAAREPYTEEVPPSPQSTYALSKLLGDWFALDAPGAFLLRVESLFGLPREWTGRRGTLDKIVDGLEQGRDVTVFTDRVVSPSHVEDVADATRHLVETGATPGLYHCVNSGCATWHEVAQEAARRLGVTPRLQPITMDQVTLKAARPRFCALANGKLAAAGFVMPSWQDALGRWLRSRV